jgi:hypothetical protein
MSLSDITRAVTEKVEAVSGYPVVVQPDPLLKTLATVRMARGGVPFHTVLFNSSSGIGHDYLVCFQCGFSLRVDAWVTREYPELAEEQPQAAARQLNDNAASLQPQVRQMTPPKVFRPSLTMNAAFAEFWAGRLGDPNLTLPYKATNFLDAGKRLLSIFEKLPDDPAEDRKLIDAWAGELALAGWYEWVASRVDG